MSKPKRFMFNTRNFDPDYDPDKDPYNYEDEDTDSEWETEEDDDEQEEDDDEPEEVEEPPAPTFSEEQLHAAQQKSFADGKANGIQEANQQFEHMIANAMTQISANLPQIFQQQEALHQDNQQEAVNIALAIVKKILPVYSQRHGTDEVLQIIRECLENLRSEPRVLIKVNDAARDTIAEKILQEAENQGFDGKVNVVGDPTILEGDCRIEWQDGGAERNRDETWEQIEQVLTRHLS